MNGIWKRGFEWVNNVGSLGNQGYFSTKTWGNYCWWFRNPANHLGCNKKKLKIVGQTTNQQLVSESTPDFLNQPSTVPQLEPFQLTKSNGKSKQRFLKLSLFLFWIKNWFYLPYSNQWDCFLNLHLRTISTSTTHVGKYTRIHGMVWVFESAIFLSCSSFWVEQESNMFVIVMSLCADNLATMHPAKHFPCIPKGYEFEGLSEKTVILVGICCNQQFQGTFF